MRRWRELKEAVEQLDDREKHVRAEVLLLMCPANS